MYDTLAAGEWTEDIDVKVYTGTIEGTEIINLRVASMGNPILRDSINVYVTVQAGIEENSGRLTPNAIRLQAYPNPFTQKIDIRYTIQDTRYRIEDFSLRVYDVSGRLVKDLTNNLASCILHHASAVSWNGTDDQGISLPEGVYFIKLVSENQRVIEKVILLK